MITSFDNLEAGAVRSIVTGPGDTRYGRSGTTAERARARAARGRHGGARSALDAYTVVTFPPLSVDPSEAQAAWRRDAIDATRRGAYGRRVRRSNTARDRKRWSRRRSRGAIELRSGPVAGCTTRRCWHVYPHATPLPSFATARQIGKPR